MKDWIKNLLALQEADLRIRNLTIRWDMLPTEKKRMQDELEAEQKQLKESKASYQKTELEMKKVESAITAKNDKILQLQQQSAMVKKNNEYKALISEVDTCKSAISDLETKMLGLYDDQEAEQAEFRKLEKASIEKAKGVEGIIVEMTETEAELKEEIKRIEESRAALVSKVETPILHDYMRLLKRNNGVPVAKVNGENCGNCHLKLMPQTTTEARKGAFTRCENCAHILYLA